MLGCDYHCGYCQNWITSQALRDPVAGVAPRFCTAEQLVQLAVDQGAEIVASTYNEPLITSEWAVEVFKVAKARGLTTAYVSNGNATPEVLEYLRPWVDLYKVDLKGFNDKQYRKLGGLLETVKDTDSPAGDHGLLGGGGDARGSRLQRFRSRAGRNRWVPGVGVRRHSLARDCLPS